MNVAQPKRMRVHGAWGVHAGRVSCTLHPAAAPPADRHLHPPYAHMVPCSSDEAKRKWLHHRFKALRKVSMPFIGGSDSSAR
jgi:hypothetical protein